MHLERSSGEGETAAHSRRSVPCPAPYPLVIPVVFPIAFPARSCSVR